MASEGTAMSTLAYEDPRFFRLPLELREAIYSYLNVVRDVTDFSKGFNVEEFGAAHIMPIMLHVPDASAYLICRQFTMELKACLSRTKSRKLTIHDHLDYTEWPKIKKSHDTLDLPVEASIFATCYPPKLATDSKWICDSTSNCAAYPPFEWHTEGIQDLFKERPRLHTLQIDLYISWHESDRSTWPQSQHVKPFELAHQVERLTELPELTRLRVYKLYKPCRAVPEGRHDLWVSWDDEEEWQVPEERTG